MQDLDLVDELFFVNVEIVKVIQNELIRSKGVQSRKK